MKNITWDIGLLSLSMIIAYLFAINHKDICLTSQEKATLTAIVGIRFEKPVAE